MLWRSSSPSSRAHQVGSFARVRGCPGQAGVTTGTHTVLCPQAQGRPLWASTSYTGSTGQTRGRCQMAAAIVEGSSLGALVSYTVAPPTSRWTSWEVSRDEVWDCQRAIGIEVQSLTSPPALGLLLSRRSELRPLRVYGEQAEATEFPLPGVSNRSLFGKTSQEGRPNQSLRYDPFVCAGIEARGPPLGKVLPRFCLPGASPFTIGSASIPTHMQQRSENLMPSFGRGKYSQGRSSSCKWWSWQWDCPLAGSLDDMKYLTQIQESLGKGTQT